jgi:16S rRNA (uracil1498-N3)-methyltransferase
VSAPVFLAEPALLGRYAPGEVYVLEGAEARHAGVVQRRRRGERVDVVDGQGVRLECRIAEVEPGRLTLEVEGRRDEPAPRVRLALVQALAKGDRDEMAIEAATEVGVDEVIPWQAARSVVVWRGERAAKSRARWIATVREATKQSRRAFMPTVSPAVDSAGLVELVAQRVAEGGHVLVLHESADQPISAVPLPDRTAPDGDVVVIVGPEGGITDGELAALAGAGGAVVRMGPNVLRTSTAGPVALAVLAERLGRWG